MKRLHYILLSFLGFTLLMNCKNSSENKEEAPKKTETIDDRIFISTAQWQENKMELVQLTKQDIPQGIKATGTIDVPPKNKAVVSAFMGGYVKNTPLLVGDKVKKGQRLLTIESPEFVTIQQNYLEESQKLEFLKSEFERQKTLFEEKITSKKKYLQAKSEYNTAIARFNGLRKQLQLLNINPAKVSVSSIVSTVGIYAPIAGSITKINVVTGSYISPSTEILELVNNNHMHVELSVFEKDAIKLKKGQKISFKIPELSEKTFDAVVHLVGKSINKDRRVEVHGHIDKSAQNNFLTGMFVDAVIETSKTEATVLPETAVVEVDNIFYGLVFNEKNDKGYYFDQKELKTGTSLDNFTEVKETTSITNKTQFLKKGAFNLLGE